MALPRVQGLSFENITGHLLSEHQAITARYRSHRAAGLDGICAGKPSQNLYQGVESVLGFGGDRRREARREAWAGEASAPPAPRLPPRGLKYRAPPLGPTAASGGEEEIQKLKCFLLSEAHQCANHSWATCIMHNI